MREWIVEAQDSGTKLLAFLSAHLEGCYSARSLKRAIEQNGCQVNQRTERFASTLLGAGDRVCLHLSDVSTPIKRMIDSERIIAEDESLLIYNKPARINCDESGILHLFKQHTPSACLVHRLDRDTTGVLVVAKDPSVLESLIGQFKAQSVRKRYLAIVDGHISNSHGMIENYLGKKRSYAGQTIWGSVDPSTGLYACTEWERISSRENASLVACYPKTGRTHQLRVHLAEMGHPILGDVQYGRKFQCSYHPRRYLLHAEEIQFIHPVTGKPMIFSAPLPEDFKQIQHNLFRG